MKNKFVIAHMKAAEVYSQLSHGVRLKVGAIVVKDDRIISIGYNGTPAGWDNSCENVLYKESNGFEDVQALMDDGWVFGCDKDSAMWTKRVTKPEVIHAEANAIAKLAKSQESGKDSFMFITHAPCIECSKLIFTSGVKKVFYKNDYRDSSGVEFLKKCNVEVEKYYE